MSIFRGFVFLVLLVVLVLFLMVGNLRVAVVVACSLPLTALLAFIMMSAASVTANLMSLGGLAIAVGMVVDGSIVVTENIVRRLREQGDTATTDCVRDTAEIALVHPAPDGWNPLANASATSRG